MLSDILFCVRFFYINMINDSLNDCDTLGYHCPESLVVVCVFFVVEVLMEIYVYCAAMNCCSTKKRRCGITRNTAGHGL